MTTKTIGLCLFAALLGIFAGCEQPDDERLECQDFIAAVEDCVMESNSSGDEEPLLPRCVNSCERQPHLGECIDAPFNGTIQSWVTALRNDCELYAYKWATRCVYNELGEDADDTQQILEDVCVRLYFDPDPSEIPGCAGYPDYTSWSIEVTECA